MIWVGDPRCLTAYREGVTRVPDLETALAELIRIRGPHVSAA
jgi:hypothetical protein